jgi:hypothetical protein
LNGRGRPSSLPLLVALGLDVVHRRRLPDLRALVGVDDELEDVGAAVVAGDVELPLEALCDRWVDVGVDDLSGFVRRAGEVEFRWFLGLNFMVERRYN